MESFAQRKQALVSKYGLDAGAMSRASTVFVSMVWGERYSSYVGAHCDHMEKILSAGSGDNSVADAEATFLVFTQDAHS